MRLDDVLDLWLGGHKNRPIVGVSGELVRYYARYVAAHSRLRLTQSLSRSLLDGVTLHKLYNDALFAGHSKGLPTPCTFKTFEVLVLGYITASRPLAAFRASAPAERPRKLIYDAIFSGTSAHQFNRATTRIRKSHGPTLCRGAGPSPPPTASTRLLSLSFPASFDATFRAPTTKIPTLENCGVPAGGNIFQPSRLVCLLSQHATSPFSWARRSANKCLVDTAEHHLTQCRRQSRATEHVLVRYRPTPYSQAAVRHGCLLGASIKCQRCVME